MSAHVISWSALQDLPVPPRAASPPPPSPPTPPPHRPPSLPTIPETPPHKNNDIGIGGFFAFFVTLTLAVLFWMRIDQKRSPPPSIDPMLPLSSTELGSL
jgi:hypothetical protein